MQFKDSLSDKFKRSWDITKKTFNVMKEDKEIVIFPILGTISSIIMFIIFVFPFFLVIFATNKPTLLTYFGLFVFYFVTTFTSVFFNAGIVHIAKTRFEGGDATFMQGLGAAWKHLGKIIAWSLLSATVGLILNGLQRQAREKGGILGIVGAIITSLIGLVWAIVSLFVVPAMIIKNLGPIEALKSSAQTVKKTWGESLIKYWGLGMVRSSFMFLFVLILLIPGIILVFQGSFIGAGILIGLFVLVVMLISVVFSAANTIFDTALFVYADSGKVSKFYSKEEMSHAFVSKKK
jgi:hypothetical protein